jgi:CRISPR-associated exonuclease Cas4
MFAEEDYLPISALQHFAFCPRQWALIHLEGMWEENVLTIEGKHLHERVDASPSEMHGALRVARGLRIHAKTLGIYGRADVVEFERADSAGDSISTTRLPRLNGRWRVRPVEYKHGKPKLDACDEVQLCAQALCLEEMLDLRIEEGAIFYGKPRRRKTIALDEVLRCTTLDSIKEMRALWLRCETPRGTYTAKCDNCSLLGLCQPRVTGGIKSARDYFVQALSELVDVWGEPPS